MKITNRPAVVIAVFLFLLCASSLIFILLPKKSGRYIADIYQNGELVNSIPLGKVSEAYSFVIEGEYGCRNEIQVRPGCIGIISADCPDKLCVRQGFLSSSGLPVTCLPNRLVIRLRPEPAAENDIAAPDAITY